MKRLYLLRHAKSAWDDPALRDRDRPLAPRGRKAAKQVARWARKHDVRPQLVVCSSAVRAQETLQRVLPGLGEPTVWVEVTLYAAAAETLLARVRALPEEVDEAMLVGHNPGLMELLLLLAAPGPLRGTGEQESADRRARRARGRRRPLGRRVAWRSQADGARAAAKALTREFGRAGRRLAYAGTSSSCVTAGPGCSPGGASLTRSTTLPVFCPVST